MELSCPEWSGHTYHLAVKLNYIGACTFTSFLRCKTLDVLCGGDPGVVEVLRTNRLEGLVATKPETSVGVPGVEVATFCDFVHQNETKGEKRSQTSYVRRRRQDIPRRR